MTDADPARPLLLTNATLLDGTGTLPEAGTEILVADGRIAAVGHNLPAEDAETIDADGAFVLPGLIDCHVHLIMSAGPDDDARIRRESIPAIAWDAAANAAATLAAGVTSVRDLGGIHGVTTSLRDRVNAGRAVGPRMRAAGSLICMTGGHGWWFGREADGPDDVRKAVREQLKAGADCVKFMASGGVMTPRVDPRSPQLSEEELRAGVEEAHKAFVKAAAHAQATDAIKNAVRGGIDSIEHGVYLDDEAVAMMHDAGTFLVPTLVAPDNISRNGVDAGIPAYMVEKSDMVREVHRESFKRALAAGVRIALGTDAGTPFNHHGANARELQLMVECGMHPLDAITAATREAAELLDVLHETGTIEPSKSADLLLVRGDPIADISVLADPSRIAGILARGEWVKHPTTEPVD